MAFFIYMIKEYIDQHKQRFLDELFQLLRIPSVSADPKFSDHMLETANQVKDFLSKLGFL